MSQIALSDTNTKHTPLKKSIVSQLYTLVKRLDRIRSCDYRKDAPLLTKDSLFHYIIVSLLLTIINNKS